MRCGRETKRHGPDRSEQSALNKRPGKGEKGYYVGLALLISLPQRIAHDLVQGLGFRVQGLGFRFSRNALHMTWLMCVCVCVCV